MSLTTPMKIILALVIVALCGAGFYLLDWQSKYARLEQETKNLQDAQAQLDKAKEDLKQLPELTKQMEAKEKELQDLVASKFTKEDPQLFVANYIAEIERMVVGQQESTGDYDFVINSITPGAEQRQNAPSGENKDGGAPPTDNSGAASTPEALQGFPTRVFQMQMTGRYTTLVDFLYQLGALKLDRLVTINKISLSPTGKGSGSDSPVLTIQIPITAYLRQGG